MKTTTPPAPRAPQSYGHTKREAEELRGLIARLRGYLACTDGPRARLNAIGIAIAERHLGINRRPAGAR